MLIDSHVENVHIFLLSFRMRCPSETLMWTTCPFQSWLKYRSGTQPAMSPHPNGACEMTAYGHKVTSGEPSIS